MHITLIVPFVAARHEDAQITDRCIGSFKDKVDRVILIKNGGSEPVPNGLLLLANKLIDLPFNILLAGAINTGYLEAVKFPDTEFLVFANNDTADDHTDLKQLCKQGAICSPHIGAQPCGWGAHASFFCIHKDDFMKVGWWLVNAGSAADEQWFKRAQQVLSLELINSQSVLHEHPAFTNSYFDTAANI